MQTGTILDDHARQNPRPWWRRGRKSPTALELAAATLEETRRDRLDHAHKQEYHAAMVKMLDGRELRLQRDIAKLSNKRPQAADAQPASDTLAFDPVNGTK